MNAPPVRTCAVTGCDRPFRSLNYCNAHYLRLRKFGDPTGGEPLRQRSAGQTCTVPGCARSVRCKGLCASHYSMKLTYGRTEAITADQRFWAKVAEGEGGCWIWVGAIGTGGYGNFYHLGRPGATATSPWRTAHRYAYEAMRCEIPEGLELDHLCRVRACVNPWHLEPVSPAENQRRSAIAWGMSGAVSIKMIHEYRALRARILTEASA